MGFMFSYYRVKIFYFEDYIKNDKDLENKVLDLIGKIEKDKKISINYILELDKKDQISFFMAIKLTDEIEDILNLNDFLKLRQNKKSMDLLYKSVFDKEEVSIDDFLKSNPDSEILSIFYSNLMYVSLSKQSLENIINLDKNSQIIIFKKIIKLFSYLMSEDKNIDKSDYFWLMMNKLLGFIEVKDMTDKELLIFIDKINIFYPIFFGTENASLDKFIKRIKIIQNWLLYFCINLFPEIK